MPDVHVPAGPGRQRYLVLLLHDAANSRHWRGARDWDGLVRLALQYGRRSVPRLKPSEFEEIRMMTVGDLFAGALAERN